MGFYVRKSVRVGLLRFNFSKLGLGVSTGIKGFRVGFGPRGNYVHASAGGFQYRTTLTPKDQRTRNTPTNLGEPGGKTEGNMTEIDSDMSLLFQSSSEDELVAEITQKVRKFSFWKPVGIVAIALGFFSHPYFFTAALVLTPLVFLIDENRRSVVLFYDFESGPQQEYEQVVGDFNGPLSAKKVWHMEASGVVKDRKRNAGAAREFRRKSTAASLKPPRFLKVNIPVPTIGVGKQTLCFLPNKLLILSPNQAATVKYSDLNIEIALSRFIESDGVPSDAEVVDHTWQYVNKAGGPDKRFKNNRKFPICAYDAIGFSSTSGLNEMIQVSKRGQFDSFRDRVLAVGRKAA